MRNLLPVLTCLILISCGGRQDKPDRGELAYGIQKQSSSKAMPAPPSVTKVYGYRDRFTITVSGQTVTLTNKSDGIAQTFSTAQELQFFDRSVSFDLVGEAGQAYRIYQAAFGRKPDAAGLGFWIYALKSGATLSSVSSSFQKSSEFKTLFGDNVGADRWITLVYNNVLKRNPDEAGKKWWVGQLEAGADRSQALIGFSESEENKQNLALSYANGIEFIRVGGPIVPFRTSYENRNNVTGVQTNFPGIWDESMSDIRNVADSSQLGFNPRSLAFADFSQSGSYEVFLTSPRFLNRWPNDNKLKWADAPAKSYFLRKNSAGKWEDITDRYLDDERDRFTCITTSYSLIADFNNDSRPDIFISCTGVDFQIDGKWTEDQASEQYMYLSLASGKYKRVMLPKIYGHQAAAYDVNSDGNMDLISVDPVIYKTPVVLWGKGDGTFDLDSTAMPADMRGKAIGSVEALPIEGKMMVIFSGVTPGDAEISWDAYGTRMLSYEGGKFIYKEDFTQSIPQTPAGYKFGAALDHIYKDGFLYSYHVSGMYDYDGILKRNLMNRSVELIYVKHITGPDQQFSRFFIADGKIVLYGAQCVFSSNAPQPICHTKVGI